MSKKEQVKEKGVKTLTDAAKAPKNVLESEARIAILEKNLYEAVTKSGEQFIGEVSFTELNHALLRVTYSFNTRNIKGQYEAGK